MMVWMGPGIISSLASDLDHLRRKLLEAAEEALHELMLGAGLTGFLGLGHVSIPPYFDIID
jgi:hypothetical protein